MRKSIYIKEAIARTTASTFLKEFTSFLAFTLLYIQAIPQKIQTAKIVINNAKGTFVSVILFTPCSRLITRNEIKARTPK